MERSTKQMKLRAKSLMALMLAVMMIFGSSMTVLAADYNITNGNWTGGTLEAGDTLTYDSSSGGVTIVVDGDTKKSNEKGEGRYDVPGTGNYNATRTTGTDGNGDTTYTVTLTSLSAGGSGVGERMSESDEKESEGDFYIHIHDYKWIIVKDPTLEEDGLAQSICECGDVEAQQPVSAATAFVNTVRGGIEAAPQGGVVEISTELYSCYTSKIMKALQTRPDVSLKTNFLAEDGTWKSFTIPAGQAPADGEQFYGFTGLGNLYGWN